MTLIKILQGQELNFTIPCSSFLIIHDYLFILLLGVYHSDV